MGYPLSVLLVGLAALPAPAQEVPEFVEQERRAEMGPPAALADGFFWDWGGWLRADAFWADDRPFRDQRAFRFYDLRLWGLMEFEGRWRIYGRMFNHWIDYDPGDGPGTDSIWRRVRPDVLYAEGRFSIGEDPGAELTVRAGRQFLSLGRGTLFFNNADGLKLELGVGDWDFNFFAARSIRHFRDLDPTRPDKDSNRMFYGAELIWSGLENHRLYLLGLVNHDRDEDGIDGVQPSFAYDSQYVGVGVRGNPATRFGYQVEAIYEVGDSHASFSAAKEDIRAWSVTTHLEYLPDTDWDLSLTFDYLWGSGDPDRGTPIGTLGGNTEGTDDTGFNAFGYVPTGYALFPRLSNIHVLKVGANFKPFLDADEPEFRNMEFGAAFFAFFKDETGSSISDPRATNDDADVGQEIDLYWRWRIYSDLGFNFRLGVFFPGDAYPNAGGLDDTRLFASVGMVFSF
jgi:hypothetical protein